MHGVVVMHQMGLRFLKGNRSIHAEVISLFGLCGTCIDGHVTWSGHGYSQTLSWIFYG
ncbi:unnamed protein product [Mycena citricolor]|uniref:Uncharacterized protein n=1 Tax=Mycena citricolor TaxID=2018698 RepID=A0AAD2HAS5_9AGAR|nr:unnamed protein product [Mycena citricolor]